MSQNQSLLFHCFFQVLITVMKNWLTRGYDEKFSMFRISSYLFLLLHVKTGSTYFNFLMKFFKNRRHFPMSRSLLRAFSGIKSNTFLSLFCGNSNISKNMICNWTEWIWLQTSTNVHMMAFLQSEDPFSCSLCMSSWPYLTHLLNSWLDYP
jgi:hypothetical protein